MAIKVSYELVNDSVNHPAHYISETGMETIDVIEAFTFDLKGIEAVCTGNVLKYICRWKNKNSLEDLEKARWYLNRLIDHVDALDKENFRREECRKEALEASVNPNFDI